MFPVAGKVTFFALRGGSPCPCWVS
jgi:hypothetical protein